MVKVLVVDAKPAQRDQHRYFLFLLLDNVHFESIIFKRETVTTN